MNLQNLMLALAVVVLVNFAQGDDDTIDPQCEEETSQLMKYSLEPSNLPYTEPDVETEKATFAMGCFWGVEAVFATVPGVIRVKAGYTGGKHNKPTYKDLVDHFEAVEVEFNPKETDFQELLKVFWANHDPTYLEKGKTSKNQYRSGIFCHNEEQADFATNQISKRVAAVPSLTYTAMKPAREFFDAEDYHQKYFLRQHKNLVSSLGLTDADFLSSSRATRLVGYIEGYGSVENFEEEAESLGLSHEQVNYVKKVRLSKTEGSCAKKPIEEEEIVSNSQVPLE